MQLNEKCFVFLNCEEGATRQEPVGCYFDNDAGYNTCQLDRDIFGQFCRFDRDCFDDEICSGTRR